MKAVRFDEYGDSSVLHIRDVNVIPPTSGQVLVKVQYAGINPGEIVIREGAMRDFFPARFPGEGQGSDFAGSIVELGTGVDHLRVGEAVIGMSDKRSAHAEYVTIAANRVVPMPKGLDPRVAASLYVAATTAQATVDTVAPQPGETVAVSAAAPTSSESPGPPAPRLCATWESSPSNTARDWSNGCGRPPRASTRSSTASATDTWRRRSIWAWLPSASPPSSTSGRPSASESPWWWGRRPPWTPRPSSRG